MCGFAGVDTVVCLCALQMRGDRVCCAREVVDVRVVERDRRVNLRENSILKKKNQFSPISSDEWISSTRVGGWINIRKTRAFAGQRACIRRGAKTVLGCGRGEVKPGAATTLTGASSRIKTPLSKTFSTGCGCGECAVSCRPQ